MLTHGLSNMKGFGLTPSFGDRRGFMPPQLKTNKRRIARIGRNFDDYPVFQSKKAPMQCKDMQDSIY